MLFATRLVTGLAFLVTSYRVFATIVQKNPAASSDSFSQALFTMKSGGCARLGEWFFLIVRYPSPWPNHMSLIVSYLDNHTWWFGAARFARKSIIRPSI